LTDRDSQFASERSIVSDACSVNVHFFSLQPPLLRRSSANNRVYRVYTYAIVNSPFHYYLIIIFDIKSLSHAKTLVLYPGDLSVRRTVFQSDTVIRASKREAISVQPPCHPLRQSVWILSLSLCLFPHRRMMNNIPRETHVTLPSVRESERTFADLRGQVGSSSSRSRFTDRTITRTEILTKFARTNESRRTTLAHKRASPHSPH
jgi:hypothetical protein